MVKSKRMCYNETEVSVVENEELDLTPEEGSGYQPRPAWQVWAARIGLVLFILVLIMYYINLFRGGA